MCTNLRSLSLVTDLDSMALSHLLKQYSHQLSSLRSLVIKYERIDAIPNGLRYLSSGYTDHTDAFQSCSEEYDVIA